MDFSEDSEAVALVEGEAPGTAGFQVDQLAISIALLQYVAEEMGAEFLSLGGRLDAQEGEIPMVFGGVIIVHLLKERKGIREEGGMDRFFEHLDDGLVVPVHAGGKPCRGPGVRRDKVDGALIEGGAGEGLRKFGEGISVGVFIGKEPANGRVGAEGGDESGDDLSGVVGLKGDLDGVGRSDLMGGGMFGEDGWDGEERWDGMEM